MANFINHGELKISSELYSFIADEALQGLNMSEDHFWFGFEELLQKYAEQNREFLLTRDNLQEKLDAWYKENKTFSQDEHKEFLKSIGYLCDAPEPFEIKTQNVDPEIAEVAAPQLVVPADNARYALNAANARWGSLFDACYGTDVIEDVAPYEKSGSYNPKRGEKVFELAFGLLDEIAPLSQGNWADVQSLSLENKELLITLSSAEQTTLQNKKAFKGYLGSLTSPSSILLVHNGLHVQILIDKNDAIGKTNALGLKDVIVEAALSSIQDCEDSVAAVDASDKVNIYRNWLGMMNGDLECVFENKGRTIQRTLNPDREFLSPCGEKFSLKGRTLLLIRNVGIHMYTDAVTYKGEEIPEGFLDAYVTTLCGLHDIKKTSGIRNSVNGSIYIVKPKCHGDEEIAFIDRVLSTIEERFGISEYSIKMGIMDEERRTTINLAKCIKAAKNRVFFINTGFLDRTGDEIHSMMELSATLPKEEIKKEPWLKGYEEQNVSVGLNAGFQNHAQIGKGMWTMPDSMNAMLQTKIAHPLSGANTAWVPSPTAATIHALHYHKVDVKALQVKMRKESKSFVDAILTPPVLKRELSAEEIQKEIENNIQSILGYVVRWVDQGIGCSKVPDINNVELMEDRATLRISSQHLANWLHHGIISQEQVVETYKKMAVIVDGQNAKDANYKNMAPEFEKSIAFGAALELALEGRNQPNGYTEFILHKRRREVKASK